MIADLSGMKPQSLLTQQSIKNLDQRITTVQDSLIKQMKDRADEAKKEAADLLLSNHTIMTKAEELRN